MKLQTSQNNLPIEKIKRLVELDKQYDTIKAERDQLRSDLLKVTQELDVLTLKTGEYTISRGKRLTPQVTSFETLKNSLTKANIPWDVIEVFAPHTINSFREVAKQGIELDGLEVKETQYISIRTKGGKDE